uniref:Thioredoxin domain containing 8 n=1 Tax=Canis lupus dingo TaxID=286419 RepID=A0A8C0LE90_CANLU
MVQSIKDMDELKTFLKAAGCKLVVVEFSAKWCGPCQRIYPLVHELAQIYHVKAVPTFQMFKQTQKVCFHGNWQKIILQKESTLPIPSLECLLENGNY